MRKMDPDEVVRMYEAELLTIRQIAERLGRSYGAVHRIVSRHATPRSPGYRTGDELVPCGSKRAYQRHLDRGEEPDEQCKRANREYTNEFDRRTGTSRARNRAYRRLAKSFAEVFEALLNEEKSKVHGTNEEGLGRRVLHSRVRERAHRRLARLYPDTFQQILADEKATVNTEPQKAD
jgi:IS30 family transposase